MLKTIGNFLLRHGWTPDQPYKFLFDKEQLTKAIKDSDTSITNAINDLNKNLSQVITSLLAQIQSGETSTINRIIYDVDWSRIKADHNDYTNGVNHFEIIDKQDDEVLWAEVTINDVIINKYQYGNTGVRVYDNGELNINWGQNVSYESGNQTLEGIVTVKVRAAKILKFIDPVMEKALSAYYANTVTNVAGYGLVHVDNKLLDVEAEKITALDSMLHTRTGISDIWHDLKTTEDFKLLPNLTAFNGPIIAASTNYITDLDTLYIPKSVKEINGFLITSIPDFTLKHIVVEEGNPVFDSRDNCDCLIRTADNAMIGGCMNSKIPASVTTVDGWWYGKGIKRLSLPDTLTSWPSTNTDLSPAHYKTFPDLEYLKLTPSVKIYDGTVTTYSPNLKEIIISKGIEKIMDTKAGVLVSSNDGVVNPIVLEFPSTITKIGLAAFYSCFANCVKLVLHCPYNANMSGIIPGPGFSNLQEIIFDGNVEIPLAGNTYPSLTKITCTDNVTSIPIGFASSCGYLTEVNLGKNLTEIPVGAFSRTCVSKINAPKVTSIGDSAFQNSLQHHWEYINIPNVETIGNNVFGYGGYMQDIVLNWPKLKTIGQGNFVGFTGKLTALNIETIHSSSFDYGGSGDNGSVITIGGQAKFINGSGQESSGTSHIGGQLIIKGDSCDYRNTMLNVYAIRLHCTGEAKISDIYACTKLELNSGSVTINNSQTNRFSYLIVPSVSHYAVTTTLKDDSSLYGNDYKHIYTDYECTNSVGNFVIEPEGDNTEIKPYVFQLTNIRDANTDDKYLIDIKSGITKIGAKAFYHLLMASNKPVEIYIPASVTEIGEKAFEGVPTSNQEGTYYFYGAPPTGVVGGIQENGVTVKVKPEYLEQWQAVEWQTVVTLEVMDE